jgi:ABC-type lipoprotein export system ATPase subunit
LLADEPTGNLDFRTGEMIVSLLEDLHSSHQLTSIFVTHNLSFAARCDRILQLDKGVLAPWTGDGLPLCRPGHEQPIMWKGGGNYV